MEKYRNYLLGILFLILIIFRFYKLPEGVFNWDVFGYYLYLPATFIYNDIKLLNHDWLNGIIIKYETTATLYQAYSVETGNWLIRYTMGNSILLLPFFFIAHLVVPLLNFPADGFSLPYQIIVTAGAILYACLGLFCLWKILNKFFNSHISSLTILIIFFGTNYPQLTIEGTLLTHNFLFTLYAVLIYFTIQWHEKQSYKNISFIGLATGLIIIVRPTEAVCILIPILWNIFDKKSINIKFNLIKNNIPQIALGIIIAVICVLPQLFYWKYITGNFIIDPYNYAGEGLDFHSPHISKFLFSFRKGWFIYTPIIFFSIVGLYYLYKSNKNILLPVLIFLIVDIYILSSWTVWWYSGASYSQRAIVPAYTLLAIPFGYFIKELLNQKKNIRNAFYVIGSFLIALNLFQWWQFSNNIISKESMTKEYYFAIFGKITINSEAKKLLLVERSVDAEEYLKNEKDYTSSLIYYNDFNINSLETDTNSVLVMEANNPYSPGPDISFTEITRSDHAWLRITTRIFMPVDFEGELPVIVSAFHHNGKPYKYKGKNLNHDEIKLGEWKIISFDYLTPEVRTKKDNLKVYIWHRAKDKIYIDYLKVESFEKK